MIQKLLPLATILFIFALGATLYLKSFTYEDRFRFSKNVTRKKLTKAKEWYQKEFSNLEAVVLLKQTGIKISISLFQVVRYSILLLWLTYATYIRFHDGLNVNIHIVLWLITLLATKPSAQILKFKSLFYLFCEQLSTRNKTRSDIEIDRCFSQLKNIAISMSQSALSSDYIIREVTKYTKVTKPHFQRLLGFWCDCRYKEGQEYFTQAIGTDSAKALAGLFGKLEYITPDNFISQIELYQSQVGEQRKTAVKKGLEAQGNLVFLIALLSGFIILINFFVVVVGIDAWGTLQKVSF